MQAEVRAHVCALGRRFPAASMLRESGNHFTKMYYKQCCLNELFKNYLKIIEKIIISSKAS